MNIAIVIILVVVLLIIVFGIIYYYESTTGTTGTSAPAASTLPPTMVSPNQVTYQKFPGVNYVYGMLTSPTGSGSQPGFNWLGTFADESSCANAALQTTPQSYGYTWVNNTDTSAYKNQCYSFPSSATATTQASTNSGHL